MLYIVHSPVLLFDLLLCLLNLAPVRLLVLLHVRLHALLLRSVIPQRTRLGLVSYGARFRGRTNLLLQREIRLRRALLLLDRGFGQ